MTKQNIRKSEKKVLLYLLNVHYADMNEVQKECRLTDKERTLIEMLLAQTIQPNLIKKFSILGVTKKGIGSYTLTGEGRRVALNLRPWYKKIEVWTLLGVLMTAVFTGLALFN